MVFARGRLADPFERAAAFADARGLLPAGSSVLVGLSGGADSTFLLHLIAALRAGRGLALAALHVDHATRPRAEHEADLEACRGHCAALDVPLLVRRVPEGTGADEAALRDARLALLEAAAAERGADRIALGHTASDRAETVLFNLLRGAGLRGAAAMAERHGAIVRPLLALTREEVRSALGERGIVWRDDPTNASPARTRARLRLAAFPALEAAVPGGAARLAAFAERAGRDEAHLSAETDALFARLAVPLPAACALDRFGYLDAPRALRPRLFERLLAAGAGPGAALEARHTEALEAVAASASGKRAVRLPGGRLLERDGDLLVARPAAAPPPPPDTPLDPPGRFETLGAALEFSVEPRRVGPAPGRLVFDLDRLALPLLLRGPRPGDRLRPLGAPGPVRLKKLLANRRIPRYLRPHAPLCQDAAARLLFAAGVRGDVAPVSAGTRRTLVVTVARHAVPGLGFLPMTGDAQEP